MSDPRGKSHICVDFDGVIHMYNSGWKGATIIPDNPVPGALQWLADMVHDGPEFQICVYSSRSKEPEAIEAMKLWLKHHLRLMYKDLNLDDDELDGASQFVIDGLEFPTQKPAANMTIDDRAFHFQGTFPTPAWLRDFKPWNKRGIEMKTIGPIFVDVGKVAYEAHFKERGTIPFAPWGGLTRGEQYVWEMTAAAVIAEYRADQDPRPDRD